MYYVKNLFQHEELIKKSRFIGIVVPCQSERDAIQHLNQIQQQFPDASHLVFAYRIKTDKGIITRFHDAGEPSGTAGKPVFQHLAGKDLINILCVVVRYFGGVKLGAGGLTRAYSNAAKHVIEASSISEYIEYSTMQYTLDYKQMKNFEYHLKKFNGEIIEQLFTENIKLLIKIPEANAADFSTLFSSYQY